MAPILLFLSTNSGNMNETLNQVTNFTNPSVLNVETEHDVNGTTSQSPAFQLALKFLDFLNVYYLAVIILFGMVGNLLSFLVFTQTHLKLRSSSYYLAALAVSDFGFLVTLLVVWLNHFGVDLFNRPGFCQALVYLSSISSCMSGNSFTFFVISSFIHAQFDLNEINFRQFG